MHEYARTCGLVALPTSGSGARPRGGSRLVDVAPDLLDELRLARERALLAEVAPQLDDEPLAIEVATEVEQERFDPALAAPIVRVDTDRDRGAMLAHRACVDPERRHDQALRHGEVRGREPERASTSVPGHDGPLDLGGPPEQPRGSLNLAGAQQLTDVRRRDAFHQRDHPRL